MPRPSFEVSRRSLLAGAAAGAVTLGLDHNARAAGIQFGSPWAARTTVPNDPWSQAAGIANSLANPTFFPNRDFYVTAYGAAPCQLAPAAVAYTSTSVLAPAGSVMTHASGSPDCYAAFDAAIKACHAAGGGRVVVPAGNWYCAGPIVLLSNVNFHLSSGAQIWFSNNPADFAKYGPYDCGANGKLTLMRWQGNDCLNFSPLIYAYKQNNIAVTGEDWTSIFNGQGGTFYNSTNCWWTWKGKSGTAGWVNGMPGENTNNANNLPFSVTAPQLDPSFINLLQYGNMAGGTSLTYTQDPIYLPDQSEAGIPAIQRIYGFGHQLRPQMLQFIGCTNILLSGYQTNNTPFWQCNPVGCTNLTIRGIYSNSNGPNNDGCDPEACNNVLIENCQFNTGDDCIALDSGKDLDIQYGPCQNVVIQNCIMQSGHGGITIGSIDAGGVQNIYAQNCIFQNTYWSTSTLQVGIRLKSNMNRGGFLRNFYARNLTYLNGVQATAGYGGSQLPTSPFPANTVSNSSGAFICFDCDYNPALDFVRTRPPQVSNINISNVTVTPPPGRTTTAYQAILILGPVAADYNGPLPMPTVYPVENVTISDCDLGTPTNMTSGTANFPLPGVFLYNAKNIVLSNVKIAGQTYNTTLSANV